MVFGDYSLSPPRKGQPPAGGLFPGGVIRAGTLTAAPFDPSGVAESVAHSWYHYDSAEAALPPWQGETTPDYTGPEPPFTQLDVAGKYSWLKAPRYQGMAVEVGPLARMLVGYVQGDARIGPLVAGALHRLKVPPGALMSTLGRILARGLETQLMAQYSLDLVGMLRDNIDSGDLAIADTTKWDPSSWPAGQVRGVGFHEAPRGRAVPLGRHRERPHQQLPGRRAHRPGTRARVTRRETPARTRLRWSVRRSSTRSVRWRSSGRCTRSIPAWPAPRTSMTPTAAGSSR